MVGRFGTLASSGFFFSFTNIESVCTRNLDDKCSCELQIILTMRKELCTLLPKSHGCVRMGKAESIICGLRE